ncbi:dihydrofolate reductase family protein [Streptomyces sp. NPDC057545]|uniref:dihydrofolate reductase family protein n=1 Tax=Streptomyces sp. NPDC057545 TaxID=3346164 RepID=UPI00368E1001
MKSESDRSERACWHNTTVLSADVAAEVARTKERTEGGELQIHGSGSLARFLMAHDLIDQYNLLVFPVVLGRGRRLFPDGGLPTAFEQTEARTTASGISIHSYRPTGRARFGSFALDD